MKVYDYAKTTSGLVGSTRAADRATGNTWRIGKGRVTTAELESWQLGPDLTAVLDALYAPPAAQRRHPRRAASR